VGLEPWKSAGQGLSASRITPISQWVDGEVIVLSPASRQHAMLADCLRAVVGFFIEVRELGVVISAPFQMKTGPDLPGREPDVLFIASEHLARLKETYLDRSADLVIEIVSPESRLRDHGTKFAEYEMGGVREYWLLDPERRRADFSQLDPQGRYRLIEPDPEGIYPSVAISGFRLRIEWLWQDPLPRMRDVLRELGLV